MSSAPIKVGVRLRPLVAHEKGQQPCLSIHDEKDVAVISAAVPEAEADKAKEGPWRFDHALDSSGLTNTSNVTNAQIYDLIGRGIVEHALEGFNACLFCYGQTGTGKTTTILGDKHAGPGLLIFLLKDFFEHKAMEESKGNSVKIAVQMLEVYNEKVFDLLRADDSRASSPNSKRAGVERSSTRSFERSSTSDFKDAVQLHVLSNGVHVQGAELKPIDSVEECLQLIEYGNERKHIAATAMNPQSSRGHTVFKLVIQHDQSDGVHLTSEVYFADLAGHENEKTTKVTGDRMVELSFINKSLMWLQSAIHALAREKKGKQDGHPHRMALFRNSKLTLLLSNALLGNSLVHVIVTLSPAAAHFATSISSLRFANEVKHITVDAHVSAHVDPNLQIKKLEAEVQNLKDQLQLAQATTDGGLSTMSTVGPSSTPDGGAGGATEKAYEEKLQIFKVDNEKLRQEADVLRVELQESQACVRCLHVELDELHQRAKQLMPDSQPDGPVTGYGEARKFPTENMVMSPEATKLLVAISGKVDNLFRDLHCDNPDSSFMSERKHIEGPRNLMSSFPLSDSPASPPLSARGRVPLSSVPMSNLRFASYAQRVNVVAGTPLTVASPQWVVVQPQPAVQTGPPRGRSPRQTMSPPVAAAANATPVRRHSQKGPQNPGSPIALHA